MRISSHNTPARDFAARAEALRSRVGAAAQVLLDQGVRPTVTRVRAALGGGSPNELAPALKHWRESVLPGLSAQTGNRPGSPGVTAAPPQIADLAHELWQRALAAAAVELKGGPTAQQVVTRTEEANSLRNQVSQLRDQLQRESLAYGELRAQAARHETIARQSLARIHQSEIRERNLLLELGEARQRIVQLEATVATSGPTRRKNVAIPRRHKRRQARPSRDLAKTRGVRKRKRKPIKSRRLSKASSARISGIPKGTRRGQVRERSNR